jgi:radical SAM protein with 4Fe4S-binding SPASM domain
MAGNFVKPLNAIMSGSSFLLSTLTGRSSISGMPVCISFELTNHCNLRCPECTSGSGLMKRESGFMDIELYKRVISELKPYLYYINLYFQGEPMIHPQFFAFSEYTCNINTVVSTNGHYLSPDNSGRLVRSGITKLIVSLDGMDQSTYSEYRINGDFRRVTEGIRNITIARKKFNSSMKLEIQFLVNKFNEHQIPLAEKFAREEGADLKLKSMQIITDDGKDKWLPLDNRFRRYKKETDGIFGIKSTMPDRCLRLWFNPVITWDGRVIPCCFDKNAEFVMGDLNCQSFRSIWNGERYYEFRQQILTARSQVHICRNCTSGMKGVRY